MVPVPKATKGEQKSVLLRLDADLADQVGAIAEVEGRSVSDVMRQAIVEHVERRRQDPAFQRRVKESLRRHEQLLRLLDQQP
jgi:predicted transcriptional regulator